MSPTLLWDQVAEKTYETGVSKGVLYIPNAAGKYESGEAWNGLVSVTESPSGAESNKQYANNRVYVNLQSAEEFAATIEAFTFPDSFAQCDGTAEPVPGVFVSQQTRKSFGFSYQTLIGNDTDGTDYGHKIHLVYGALAAPTEKAYTTVNESPEAATFSWEVSTTTIDVPNLKPTAQIVVDSTKVSPENLLALEEILYGTAGTEPRLPTPAEVFALFESTVTLAVPVAPAYNSATKTITIPVTTGVVYSIEGEDVAAGPIVITEDTLVVATPAAGYKFDRNVDSDWGYDF